MKKRLLKLLVLLLVASVPAFAQTITGKVTGPDGSPLPGVSVLVKGTTQGTATNADGNFSLNVTDPSATLVVSFIGYITQEVGLNGRTTVDVSLAEDVKQLSEVMVTALGIERSTKALQFSATQVSGDNLTQARENSLANQLSGRVAGVNVSKIASGPAGSSRVVIRGAKTLGSTLNQPLYVVDGIPMDNSNFGQAGVWGGADQGDGMTSVNPDDIQSVTVLKGASAAALYGSRAASGVILITTKKGSGRKGLGIEFNSNYVVEQINDLTDFQKKYGNGGVVGATLVSGVATKASTVDQHWNNWWGHNGWGPKLDGSPVVQFDGVSRPYSYAGDNWSRFFETGTSWTNSLSLTGGSETQNFRFSMADLRGKGVMPNTGFNRINMTLATNSKFGKKLTLVSKVMYSNEDTKNRPNLSDSPGNAIAAMYTIPNDVNINNLIGDPDKPGAVPAGFTPFDGKVAGEELQMSPNLWSQNPWWAAYQFKNSDVRDRLITSGQLRYDITDFLYIQGKAGMDWYTKRGTQLTPEGTGYQRGGAMTEYENRNREVNLEYLIGFNKAFGDINVNAFFGGNRMRNISEYMAANGNGFNAQFQPFINNSAQRNFSYGYGGYGINSVFGSAEVTYKGYLFLTGTARKDWFSTLKPGSNSILYPSVGASFVFSDAFESLPAWLSFGKLRSTWAQVGNASSVQPYSVDLTYSFGNSHLERPMASLPYMTNYANLSNPNIIPFTSTELEFGSDLKFFENRLGLDITYYNQKTTDDILYPGISRASGFGSKSVNLGKITNRGIEMLLTGTPIKGSITWDISLNFAKNNSEVVSLIEGQKEMFVEEPRTRFAAVYHIVGHPYGMIKGVKQLRAPNGQLVFNSDGAPQTDGTFQIIGTGVPDFTGGLNNTLTYKQFNLSFLIDFKSGGDIYSGTNVRQTQAGFHKQTLQGRTGEAPLTVSGVVQNGTDANGKPIYEPFSKTLTPGEAANYWGILGDNAQENFVYDASYVKLRQLTLGYNLPKSLLSKTPFQSVGVSFVGRNLAILFKNVDNIDPESAYSSSNGQGLDYYGMPSTRTYGFNLRVTF